MVSSVSSANSSTALGLTTLLQQSNTTSGGLFGTLAGGGNNNNNQALFGVLGGSSGTPQSVSTILNQQKVTSSENNIYSNAAQVLAAIKAGTYTPTGAGWQATAGYAQAQGTPVVISIDSKGQVQAQNQSQSSLSQFNPQLQNQILQLDSQATQMAQKIQANATNASWVAKLAGAESDLNAVYNGNLAPQTTTTNNWEQEGLLYMQSGMPFKISLDANGNLQVQNQATDPALADLPITQQAQLSAAINSIPQTIQDGSGNQPWQLQAESYASQGIPFYLSIDPTTSIISANENSAANITPSFLTTPPYPNIGDNSPALKQAATFIQAGEAYFFTVDHKTGQIGAVQATAQNLETYNKPSTTATAASTQASSILSLFA